MNLRKIRTESGLSMKDVASKMAVSEITISRWETGTREPSIESLIKLAQCFSCSVDDLIGGSNPTPTRETRAKTKAA